MKKHLLNAGRKLVITLVIGVSAAASFATLGDGSKKPGSATLTPSTSQLLSSRVNKPAYFSLRSGYTYRGTQVINTNQSKSYLNLDRTFTYQRGNTTYVVPMRKKVLLNNVKIDLGNRSLRRN